MTQTKGKEENNQMGIHLPRASVNDDHKWDTRDIFYTGIAHYIHHLQVAFVQKRQVAGPWSPEHFLQRHLGNQVLVIHPSGPAGYTGKSVFTALWVGIWNKKENTKKKKKWIWKKKW